MKKMEIQSLFNNLDLCASCTYLSSYSLHRLIVSLPSQKALIHIRSLGHVWRKKNKVWFGVQNHIWQSTEAHHLHLYRYAHSSYCVCSTHIWVLLYILLLFFITQLTSYCKTNVIDEHQHGTYFRYICYGKKNVFWPCAVRLNCSERAVITGRYRGLHELWHFYVVVNIFCCKCRWSV